MGGPIDFGNLRDTVIDTPSSGCVCAVSQRHHNFMVSPFTKPHIGNLHFIAWFRRQAFRSVTRRQCPNDRKFHQSFGS